MAPSTVSQMTVCLMRRRTRGSSNIAANPFR
jgi:hypothetical protein